MLDQLRYLPVNALIIVPESLREAGQVEMRKIVAALRNFYETKWQEKREVAEFPYTAAERKRGYTVLPYHYSGRMRTDTVPARNELPEQTVHGGRRSLHLMVEGDKGGLSNLHSLPLPLTAEKKYVISARTWLESFTGRYPATCFVYFKTPDGTTRESFALLSRTRKPGWQRAEIRFKTPAGTTEA